MLREFLQLPENYRKFKIDVELKRYESALANIALCEDKFNESLQFIEEHRLYKTALTLYSNSKEKYDCIAKDYAEYLTTLKKYNEVTLTVIATF